MRSLTLLGIVNVHSEIDVITNSSTEIFCVVEGSQIAIQTIIDGILDEMGCSCIRDSPEGGLFVRPHEEWSDEKKEYIHPENQFAIWYEDHARPCKAILEKIASVLNVVKTF